MTHLAYIRVPDGNADHIDIGLAENTRDFGTRDFGADRIHADEHSLVRIARTIDRRRSQRAAPARQCDSYRFF